MHGQRQLPAAGFTTCSPETFLVPIKPFKNKVYKTEDRDPGKWSLPGRPSQARDCLTSTRPWQEELVRTNRRFYLRRPGKGSGSGKLPGPARSRSPARCLPGEVRCVPALQLIGPRVALGPLQGRVADGCAAWGTRWHSRVIKPSPWQTETQGRALLGSTATGIKCSCPPVSK